MNILFVCRANVGRSQAAMEFYNQISPNNGASAGTLVDNPGEKLKDRFGATTIVKVMKEYGVDMSDNERTQIKEEMLKDYDKVVVMAEPETIPEWLVASDKTVIWKVDDAKDQSIEKTREIALDIKNRVKELFRN
jgi:protein-tyrosine-phosphatase